MVPELLDLILSWHMPVCAQEFAGNPRYTLYWCYDKGALKELLGMTRDQYRVIQSSVGKFLRRVPKTRQWLTRLKDGERWALEPSGRHRNRATDVGGSEAVARRHISRKSYIGLPPP